MKNRTIFNLTLLLAVLCISAISSGYAELPDIVHIAPAEATQAITLPAPGEHLTFNVDIASQSDIDGYQFTLTFDPTVLRYVASANGDYLLADTFVVPARVGAGQVTLVAVSLAGGRTGTGTLASVTFEVLAAKTSPLTLTEVILPVTDGSHCHPQVIDGGIGMATSQRLEDNLRISETALHANYPNPFNPETWIPYQLSTPAEVTLDIYSVSGALVRTLDLGHQAAGVYRKRSRAAYWDGKNAVGEGVASGLYFYVFTAGDFSATGKMLIMK